MYDIDNESETKYLSGVCVGCVCGVCVGCVCVCVRRRVALVGRWSVRTPFAKAGGVMGCGVV